MDTAMIDAYQRAGSAVAEISDSSSDDDHHPESFRSRHVQAQRGFYSSQHSSDAVHSRRIQTQSSGEDDVSEGKLKAADPGPFQYNKRVFITALPCLLLTLAMTGETLVLMVSVGGLVIVLMTQMAQDGDRKCVVVFALLFIPCHVLVLGTILPLLWLSVWNLALIGLTNMFCILTGGWIMLQFAAFRKEDPALCAVVEQGLFALYPCVCCALVTWVLSTVVSSQLVPFVFVFLWFVYLQLYLMPAVSSFKKTETEDEDLNVIQQPIVIAIIIVFIGSGPALHVVLTLAGSSFSGLLSLSSLAMVCVLLCLDLFLSTLLSLRQVCDYVGVPHQVMVRLRWGSGVGVLLLAYPTLQHVGLVSHFLFSLPIAVAAFAALGLMLSFRKGKMLSVSLMGLLMMLLCVWLYHLPWALTYNFLGLLPLRSFYLLVGANFMLCVTVMYGACHCSLETFGALVLLQSAAITACETGLYQAGLYSLPTFQLTGVIAAYTIHRLHVADKLNRGAATVASAIQLTKTTIGAVGYLTKEGERKGGELVDVTLMGFLTLLLFVGVLVWLFVYETKEVVTLSQMVKHLTLLMVSMATSVHSLLRPVGGLMLQDDPTSADLAGVWFGVGGVLILLYALQHGQYLSVGEQLMKVAGVMVMVGALVTITQPLFDLTLFSLYQWCEVLSVLMTAVLLTTDVEFKLSHSVIASGLLGLCPFLHVAWLLYGEGVTVLHFILISFVGCCLLAFLIIIVKTHSASDTTETFFKVGTVLVAVLVAAVFAVDVINLQPGAGAGAWSYPAWKLAFAVSAVISILLKVLSMKLGPGHLPLAKGGDKILPLLPVIGNIATISALFLARTQGPQDILLHDLWCCASSVILISLQRDSLLLPTLSPSNRATPTIVAAVTSLALSTLMQSRLWLFRSTGSIILGVLEVVNLLFSLPVYVVLVGILWQGEIWSEKAVVFSLPLNAFVFLLGSCYTAWALCVAGFVCGIGMMVYKLPLQPYQDDHYR